MSVRSKTNKVPVLVMFLLTIVTVLKDDSFLHVAENSKWEKVCMMYR